VLSTNSEVFSVIGVATFGTLYLAVADGGDAASAVRALRWVAAALGVSALLAAAGAFQARPVDASLRPSVRPSHRE